MRTFLVILLLFVSVVAVQGQQGPQPKFDISPNIAKIPEPSDFYGNWLRGDGTYRFEIKAGEVEGTVVAKYFNPDPINVESAIFEMVDGEPLLTIILRDTGYPGSKYELSFLSERRVLVGGYSRPGSEPSQVYFLNQSE